MSATKFQTLAGTSRHKNQLKWKSLPKNDNLCIALYTCTQTNHPLLKPPLGSGVKIKMFPFYEGFPYDLASYSRFLLTNWIGN